MISPASERRSRDLVASGRSGGARASLRGGRTRALGSSRLLTGQIIDQLLVLLSEFEQPSADARLRRHIRDFSEEFDLLTVAGDPVTFRPSQPAIILPQHALTPDLTNHGGKVRI